MSDTPGAPAESATTVRARTAAIRGVSPLGFALTLLCFLFAFNAVSCNTDAAKQTLHTAAGLTGGQTSTAALDACLDALRGVNLFTYSGINLAFGSAPSEVGSVPSACRSSQSGFNTATSPAAAAQAAIGVQPLALVAFIACCVGVLLGAAFLLLPRRARFALPVCALLAVDALVMLVVEQSRAQSAVLQRIDSLAAGNGAPFSLAGYFRQSSSLAYFLALAVLGAVAVVALAQWVMASRPRPQQARAPD